MNNIKKKFSFNTKRTHYSQDIIKNFSHYTREKLKKISKSVSITGRIIAKRSMKKSIFLQVKDFFGDIQVYIKNNLLHNISINLGDIIYIKGLIFKTNTNNISIYSQEIHIIINTKKIIPKSFYGISEKEIKYRKRYLDLIVNNNTKEIFFLRSKIIYLIREYFKNNNFIEVETPMMQINPGGANAQPFKTYHNSLNIPLYMRVSPELFLKQCVVGGIEKVFEINRNFRNEGVSTKHNPEFTMLEFYEAYSDYYDIMDLIERLFRYIIKNISYSNIQFEKIIFKKKKFIDAIAEYLNINQQKLYSKDILKSVFNKNNIIYNEKYSIGEMQLEIFEKLIEKTLIDPIFIIDYPIDVSPLAKRKNNESHIAERFELFIEGKEIANGFSELNDPNDQKNRFIEQIEKNNIGYNNNKTYDKNYIEALEYGLPPTGGAGIGIDRMIMILTGKKSIKDVILFPLIKDKSI